MASLEDISSIQSIASEEEQVFWIRFNCVHNWYLKSSSKNKQNLLISMIENIKDKTYLNIFLSCFNFNTDKVMMYSDCYPRTTYIYDINLKDHNRGLDDKFLVSTINSCLAWYNTLESKDQITTLTELFKISGGAILKDIYVVIRENLKTQLKANKTADNDLKIEEKFDLNQLFLEKETQKEEEVDKKGKKKVEKKPKTPLEIEIDQKRKIWEDEMKKYRILVEGKPEKGKDKGKGKGKNKSSGKSSKSEKSSKKGGKGKKGEKNLIDRIQMLPIWIVKKIFSYLDAKTLKKVADVNIYWAYVVDDLTKDKKNMTAVQKILKKMQANFSEMTIPDIKPVGLLEQLTNKEKKMMNLVERGAIHPCLRNVIETPAVGKTLLERAIAISGSHVRLPTHGYEAFPRAEGDKKDLLNTPKMVYTEAGVFKYDKKPEGGPLTIVELPVYRTVSGDSYDDVHNSSNDDTTL